MRKDKTRRFALSLLFALLSVALVACGGGGGGGSSKGNVDKYSGHYEGTVRYNMAGYAETIYPIEFNVDSGGNLTSFKINGVAIDIDEAESQITAGSAIVSDGTIKGQGSFNDPDLGTVNFTFSGRFDESGQFDILYEYTGGITGEAEIIGYRT